MKSAQFKRKTLTGVAVLMLAGAGLAYSQVPITNIINNFDTAPSSGNGIGSEWGTGSAAWDSTGGNPGGAELITATWDPTSDTPLVPFACEPGGNPWYVQTPINFSSYQTLEFDIKYDPTSDITVAQFNDVSTWPFSLTNAASANQSVFQSWATTGGAALAQDGATTGMEIYLCGGPGGQMAPLIINTNMPAAAASGWVHVVIPINQSLSQIDGVTGIVFHKWCKDTWTLATPVSARFWIDNVMLKGTTAPPAPPTVSGPTKAVKGLNIFASTEGNSYYDRQEAELIQTSGLSWVGHATAANPVTYSFTITGYPNSVNCEAFLFLSPNPSGNNYAAPDWSETNCAIFYLQGSATSATARFRYKVNETGNQLMYSGADPYTNAPGSWDGVKPNYLESGDLATVAGTGILGHWTLKFTSDTNGTIITPDGAVTNFIIPPYNIHYFAESASPGFNLDLGMQANNADAMNQSVAYADFAVSNTATPFYENFLADSVLDTNVWRVSMAGGPKGVLIVPGNAWCWVKWSLPDTGFSLQFAPTLTDPFAWASSSGPTIPLFGYDAQLLSSNDIPAGNCGFFELLQRTISGLQVLFPGETNAPNTTAGKVGTPQSFNAYDPVVVTINAVDSTFHIVNVGDSVQLSSTDSGALFDNRGAFTLSGGTVTTTMYFGDSGSFTVSATDTSTNLPVATSSSITIH